jgi:hypothetical protein
MKNFVFIVFFSCHLGCIAQTTYWKASVNTGEYGKLNLNFTLQQKGDYLFGSTPANAHKRIIGGIKSMFAKGFFRKNGSLVELDSVRFNGNQLSGSMILNNIRYILRGTRNGDVITADLTGRSPKDVFGRLEASKVDALQKPQDYEAVWAEISNLTEKFIYNKTVLETKQWKKFKKGMGKFSRIALDDAEFAYGLFFQAGGLPFTHYSLQGSKETSKEFLIPAFGKKMDNVKPTLKKLDAATFVLDVPKFNFRVSDIDSLMLTIVNSSAKNLIIDLRKNTGGDMEGAMRIGQFLSNKTFYGGVMLSQKYWASHAAPPKPEDYLKFKLMDKANYEWFKQEVKNGVEGLCIKTEPMAKTFTGKIFILTSGSTASASEPFVYTLQKENRATVIGGRTAGAVISMEYVPVRNFELTIPMLDYYTYDGKRLDKVGVEPNIKCEPARALDVALQQIQ